VIPAERWRDPGANKIKVPLRKRPASRQVLRTVVETLGERAGIAAHITPHMMRHACADHVARQAGVHIAKALLGHADIGTTQAYLGTPTLDELTATTRGITFLRTGVPTDTRMPGEAPTGIEPVYTALQAAA
jgi:integrase